MEMRKYYKVNLERLETPEFVRWFERWYGDESPYEPDSPLLDAYWSERRFALFGWHAAMLPANVSADKRLFVRSLRLHGAEEAIEVVTR